MDLILPAENDRFYLCWAYNPDDHESNPWPFGAFVKLFEFVCIEL